MAFENGAEVDVPQSPIGALADSIAHLGDNLKNQGLAKTAECLIYYSPLIDTAKPGHLLPKAHEVVMERMLADGTTTNSDRIIASLKSEEAAEIQRQLENVKALLESPLEFQSRIVNQLFEKTRLELVRLNTTAKDHKHPDLVADPNKKSALNIFQTLIFAQNELTKKGAYTRIH